MQIMINIPDAIKEMADEGDKKLIHMMWMLILVDAIKNGVVLPKGHGDLVDRSEVIKSLFDYHNGKKTIGQCIDYVTTIIEAESEE